MSGLLLDSHVLIWWLAGRLEHRRDLVDRLRTEPDVHVSAASAWEIAIKQSLGKLAAPDELAAAVSAQGFRELPVTLAHAAETRALPPLHRDPFDRILVAQARVERLTIVTHDPAVQAYDVDLLPV